MPCGRRRIHVQIEIERYSKGRLNGSRKKKMGKEINIYERE